MYVEPMTDIFLMRGINWSNNYEDTLYFNNLSEQAAFFKQKVAESGNIIFPKQSYQRHSKNSLRILANAEMIMDCNYLMFQNKGHGGIPKWFYAFITNVEYVNENTTDIYYEIDEIQTWLWGLTLGQCFVEREIPVSDAIFSNLVPESLECGEYEIGSYFPIDLGEPYYLLQSCTDALGHNTITFCNGFPSTICYYTTPVYDEATDPTQTRIFRLLDAWLNNLQDNNPENIINISIIPKKLADTVGRYDEQGQITRGEILDEEIDVPTAGFATFHGYRPKNKKLFTYPYTMMRVSNNAGQIVDYKLENFMRTDPTDLNQSFGFKLTGIANGLPSIALTPLDYNGMYTDMQLINIDNAVIMTNFPTAPWVCDTYRAYLAQNKASITTSVLSSIVKGASDALSSYLTLGNAQSLLSVYSGKTGKQVNDVGILSAERMINNSNFGVAGGLSDSVGSITSALAKISDAKRSGDSAYGLTNADMLLVSIGRQRFDLYCYSIKPEMAKIIDDYFSMYGYAQHKVKIPNINSRPYWNYTKTKGCILKGSCPAPSKSNISAIFDKGIRFWKKNEQIGDYSLPNYP